MILAGDLKDLVNRDTVTVHSTSLFKDSPVFVNSSKNYPILKELVPQMKPFIGQISFI